MEKDRDKIRKLGSLCFCKGWVFNLFLNEERESSRSFQTLGASYASQTSYNGKNGGIRKRVDTIGCKTKKIGQNTLNMIIVHVPPKLLDTIGWERYAH